MGSAAFLPQKPQAFGTHRGSATSLFTMSDDAAATAPAAAVPAGAAPLTRGQDQLPALRAARAVLKQQLKESTKEIRKEAGATPILILVGDVSPELARVDACQQTLAMWLHARLSISFLPGSPQISSHEKSPRLNDGWPGLAHCSPCRWVRLQHSCFRNGCGWAAAEIVLIFFKSRRWAMRMHTPKALKSRSLLLFEKSPRLNDGWPGLAHCSPCRWVRLQHSCFRNGCGWAAAEIVLIFFKSRRWAMRMHTPKALKSRSLLLFEKSPRLNDGWPGLAHCSPCSWVRLQHSCFRKGCGWTAAEIVLIFFKSRRWAMRMHTPKALKSRSLLLFEKSRLLGHQCDCLESQGRHVRERSVQKCCKVRHMWIQSRHQVQRFPCWILCQSQFHVPKSLWVFYLLRPLAKSEFSWPCGLSWSNVPPLPFYPWYGEQILEPNPIDTEQNKVKPFQNTVRSLLSRSYRHGAK